MTQQTIPRWPVITATVQQDGSGEVHFTDHTEPVEADDLPAARDRVRAQVAEYARDQLGRPVRLEVSDPDGMWLLGVDPDGGVQALEHDTEPDADPTQPPAPPVVGESARTTGDSNGKREAAEDLHCGLRHPRCRLLRH